MSGRAVVIQFLSLWDGLYEVSAQMSEAAASSDIRNSVITLITVRFKISLESIQELCRIEACPRLCIFIENNIRKDVFTGTEQPHGSNMLAFSISIMKLD